VARKRLRLSQTKSRVQHADTLLSTIGPATAPTVHVVLDTEAGARTLTGGAQTVQVGMGTNEEVNIGSIVKNINLQIQCGMRPVEADDDDEANGFMEWALMMVKESEAPILTTNLGTLTLGVVANHMYRNECIFTGFVPIGKQQPNGVNISIKVPRFKQKITFGDQWRFVCFFRDLKVTAVDTDTVRLLTSCIYNSWQ